MNRRADILHLPAGYGFALIKRGGTAPSGKPFTRMAYLVRRKGAPGVPGPWLAYIGTEHLDGWTKELRVVEESDIIKRWLRTVPSRAGIRAAKRGVAS